jgi:lipid-A-disaccharide synthase-like uncharacterized protein
MIKVILTIGFIGQLMFGMRFLIQWIESERKGKSHIPVAFWYFSVLGGLLLLIYAVYRRDPVFIFGQSLGLLVYIRNLYLIYRQKEDFNQKEDVGAPVVDG